MKPKVSKNDKEEVIRRKHEEAALERKAKAGIHADVCTTPLKMAKGYIRKKPLVKTIMCEKCGKVFKTNVNKKLCFDCGKKKN